MKGDSFKPSFDEGSIIFDKACDTTRLLLDTLGVVAHRSHKSLVSGQVFQEDSLVLARGVVDVLTDTADGPGQTLNPANRFFAAIGNEQARRQASDAGDEERIPLLCLKVERACGG